MKPETVPEPGREAGVGANAATLLVRVKSVTHEAQGVLSYDLRPVLGRELPAFTAGAHIDLHLPNGLVRSYSLVNPQEERHRYVIAVQLDPASRGGSRFIHETLRPGDTLPISPPRNNFPLVEDAWHSLFIAGGIGITPIWCMIQRLEALERSWELHYCTRTRQSAAFLEPLRALGAKVNVDLHFNFDQEPGGRMLDIAAVVARADPETHLYCCGPVSMLEAFERACAERPPAYVHVEYFSARKAPAAAGGFTVVLARSGLSFAVPKGKTILDTLIDHGVDVPYSCMEGVCGTCEARVLEGVPDHRDLVLSKEEKASNRSIILCCSGSRTSRLVLDL
ncbi:MAG: PDR/VanB family oxidoreductase [Elioraea sp.]|nr:PDR/VanB family oxidoreductase [Elioraea sp.]